MILSIVTIIFSIIALCGLFFGLRGLLRDHPGRNAEERMGGAVLAVIGGFLFVFFGLLAVILGVLGAVT